MIGLRSIRRAVRWCKHHLDFLDCVLEARQAALTGAQVRGNNNFDLCTSSVGYQRAASQFNFGNASAMAEGQNSIEKYNRRGAVAGDLRCIRGGFVAFRGHDGKFHAYRWDNYGHCYVSAAESSGGAS